MPPDADGVVRVRLEDDGTVTYVAPSEEVKQRFLDIQREGNSRRQVVVEPFATDGVPVGEIDKDCPFEPDAETYGESICGQIDSWLQDKVPDQDVSRAEALAALSDDDRSDSPDQPDDTQQEGDGEDA